MDRLDTGERSDRRNPTGGEAHRNPVVDPLGGVDQPSLERRCVQAPQQTVLSSPDPPELGNGCFSGAHRAVTSGPCLGVHDGDGGVGQLDDELHIITRFSSQAWRSTPFGGHAGRSGGDRGHPSERGRCRTRPRKAERPESQNRGGQHAQRSHPLISPRAAASTMRNATTQP